MVRGRAIFLSLLLLGTCVARAGGTPFRVVSDVDDTIRIAHVSDILDAGYRAIFSDEVYTGTPDLLSGFFLDGRDVTLLSRGPEFMREIVGRVMDRRSARFNRLILRDSKDPDSKSPDYKLLKLLKLLGPDERVVLMGDDTEVDSAQYEKFRARRPGSPLATYIHQVTGERKLPPGQVPYFTAFEVAVAELKAGRFSRADALVIGFRTATEHRFEEIIPEWAYCPKKQLQCWIEGDRELNAYCLRLNQRVIQECTGRELDRILYGLYRPYSPRN